MKKYKRKSWYQRTHKKKLLIDISKDHDFNYKVQFSKNILPDFTEKINDKEKFNELSLFNIHENSQSSINYEIKNFFKTENEFCYYDYQSDIEFNHEENYDENETSNLLNNNDKLLGKKTKRQLNLNKSEKGNIYLSKEEKSKNDININSKKNNKCYYVMFGDKKRLRKIN